MRLANVKLPGDLEAELKDAAARLGVSRSVLHRAALRALLSSDPSRDYVLGLEEGTVTANLTSSTGDRAQSLLESL